MRPVSAIGILVLCLLAPVLFSACKDPAHTCKTSADCGFSCSYGCVAPAWYGDKNETRECTKAEECTCVKGICYTGGKSPQQWALDMEKGK